MFISSVFSSPKLNFSTTVVAQLAFLYNNRNYSPEVINKQCKVELNIILLRVNNFDIKQKKAWNICFIICHQHETRSGKIKANKTQEISLIAQAFL